MGVEASQELCLPVDNRGPFTSKGAGLVTARPGLGTFVTKTLGDDSRAKHEPLRRELERWLTEAREAGLDDESIEALFMSAFRAFSEARA